MGSPISGILAELKLRKLEKIIEENFRNRIIFWVRYVDDVFAIIEKDIDEAEVLRELNAVDHKIKFTIEVEKDNTINYLDVKINRTENNKLETTVYRKPTNNNEIINARCRIPYNYKIASLRSYINRAIVICSSQKLIEEELKIIEKIAIENGFRRNLIQNLYRKRLKNIERIQPRQKDKKRYTATIPYCRGAGNIVKNEAAKYNINIPIKSAPNIYQYIKSDRDKIQPTETAGIYRLEYTNNKNEKGFYIGLTKRKIKERLREHKGDIKYGREKTAIAKLANSENITINYDKTKKLANYNNRNYAYCRESIEIINNNRTCNSIEHCIIDEKWQRMMREEEERRGKRTGKQSGINNT